MTYDGSDLLQFDGKLTCRNGSILKITKPDPLYFGADLFTQPQRIRLMKKSSAKPNAQHARFLEAAREAGADVDTDAADRLMGRLAMTKPEPKVAKPATRLSGVFKAEVGFPFSPMLRL